MKKFLKRLDRLLDAVIEWDSFTAQHGRVKIVTLKAIFDNLRYYPVLAFLWVAMRLLRETDSWISRGGAALLRTLVFGLGMLVVFQTSALLIAAVISITSALLPLRTAVRLRRVLRKGGLGLHIFGLILTLGLISIIWLVGVGLTISLDRGGLL